MKPTDIIYKAKSASTGEWVQGSLVNMNPEYEIVFWDEIGDYFRKAQIHPETLCIGFKDAHGEVYFIDEYQIEISQIGGGSNGVVRKIADLITLTGYANHISNDL